MRARFAVLLQCLARHSGFMQRLSCAALRRYGLSRAVRLLKSTMHWLFQKRTADAANGHTRLAESLTAVCLPHCRTLGECACYWRSDLSADSPKRRPALNSLVRKRPFLPAGYSVPLYQARDPQPTSRDAPMHASPAPGWFQPRVCRKKRVPLSTRA